MRSLGMILLLLGVGACAHEKGESQLPWLQRSLESEFPDHTSPPMGDLLGTKRVQAAAAPPPATPVGGAVVSTPDSPAVAIVAPPATPTDESSSRPVIRIVGSANARPLSHGADDHIEVTLPDERSDGAHVAAAPSNVLAKSSPTSEPSARQEYDRGLALLNARDFDHALGVFSTFLVRWPDDAAAESAMYWSGECYLAKGDLVEAADQFDRTLTRFPKGAKVPDALLRLGVVEQRLGNQDKAKAEFDRLTREFPRSDAARRVPRDHGAPL